MNPRTSTEPALEQASGTAGRAPEPTGASATGPRGVASDAGRAQAGLLLRQGLDLAAAGHGEQAIAPLRRAVELDPDLAAAWLPLCWHLTATGALDQARTAQAEYLRASAGDPALERAARVLCRNRVPEAELLLRDHLRQHPDDVTALRLLAEAAIWRQRDVEAIRLLTQCLALAPGVAPTLFSRALACYRTAQPVAAQADIEAALAVEPRNPAYRALLAAVLSKTNEIPRTLGLYEELTAEYPNQPKLWMSFGHVLKAAGRQPASIAAYRRAIELDPGIGEAWWSLANLKTVRFTPADIEAMQQQLQRDGLGDDDRMQLEFALGKALEDARRFEESFRHYSEGNRLRLLMSHYDPEDNSEHLRRSKRVFTREFFADRAGLGCPAPDPIFILGLPRSGSTLLEQILASHSQVEGTMELPDITNIARSIADRRPDPQDYDYVPLLGELRPAEWRELGERYLETTRFNRKLGRPFFIDKMPNNNAHVGLIHLILPNARIIDARRHPLAACFSNFKQHFAMGQLFSYGLENIGRYYRDYVELMAHFDAVLPGRIHRVFYERMVEDTEAEVRRLLDYCGLPFEEGCLRFYENERVVRTASSEQVRRPIYREGVDHWRNYEPWLGPLKAALGPVLESYPEVPDFGG
jgi:tetratricopeptide (TPR) repeat protein